MTALMNLANPFLIPKCTFGDPELVHTQPDSLHIIIIFFYLFVFFYFTTQYK